MKSFIAKTGATIISVLFCCIAKAGGFVLMNVDPEVDKSTLSWYQQPWAWTVAVGVFVLLIIAYIRTGERKPKK